MSLKISTGTTAPELEEPALSSSPRRWRRQTVGAFLLFHLLLPFACLPWLFSWEGVASVFLGNYLFCSLGIGLCFHRVLCHGSVRLSKWLERTLAIFGICSLQDSPCHWVALHRLHHKHSDEGDDDPHSPLQSFFWGHVGWLLFKRESQRRSDVCQKYGKDLLRDPFYAGLEKHLLWVWIFVAHTLLFFAGGFLLGWAKAGLAAGLQMGLSMLVWGVVVRIIYTWHITWAVNSICHLWGYRNYDVNDNSRNNWLVALATNGEGWHNNHHADQRSAAHGHRWWELDVTFLTIRLFQCLGWASDVVTPRPQSESQNLSKAA